MTPSFRLLMIGPSKSGKTSFLKKLAEQFGAWQKPLLTAKLQTDLYFFSIREAYHAQRNFDLLSQKHMVIDGVILCTDLSQPLDAPTLASLHYAAQIGLPLRLIVATHCDLFEQDDDMLDEYELSLRQQLSEADISNEVAPLIRSTGDDLAAQECVNSLHQLNWGIPNANKSALMQVDANPYTGRGSLRTAEQSATSSAVSADSDAQPSFVHLSQSISPFTHVSLLQGTIRLGDQIEGIVRVNQRQHGVIVGCARNGQAVDYLSAPSFGEIHLMGFAPTPNTLLATPGSVQVSTRATAQMYLSSSSGTELLLANTSGEKFAITYGLANEQVTVHLTMPKGFFSSELSCTAKIELLPNSASFFYQGLWIKWRHRNYSGGGVITGLL